MLLGLTGFAISQPVLAVLGDDPATLVFAGVDGPRLVVFALLVALVPPLALWAVVGLVGRAGRRAGDALFLVACGVLAGATASQWSGLAGLDDGWARALVGLAVAIAFPVALVRVHAVALWTRYTAVLPGLSVLLLLTASPSSALLATPDHGELTAGSDHAPVVFILLDELPTVSVLDADRGIDAARFPNLASFAEGATWYRDYTVLSSSTLDSVPTILSGRITRSSLPLWTDHPDTLFSLLAPTHDLAVSESLTRLCGFASCGFEGDARDEAAGIPGLLGQSVDIWAQRVGLQPTGTPDLGQFAEDADLADALDLAADAGATGQEASGLDRVGALRTAIAGTRQPSLGYLHLMLPHQPWRAGPDGEELVGLGVDELAGAGPVDEWDLAVLEQAHLFQAQYTDRLLGQLLDGLRADGRFDESLIVVTSDHGVTLDADHFPATRDLDDASIGDLAYVPLLVKAPGQQAGRIDDSNLMSVDLLPTLAAELGVDVPWEVDGLPAGDPGIEARGGRKLLTSTSLLTGGGESLAEFDSDDHRPHASDRLVGPITAGDHPLAGLLTSIDAEAWLGRSAEGLGTSSGATASLDLDLDGPVPAGRLVGAVDGAEPGGVVLLAVGGTVQTASPVLDGGRLAFFVPPGASGAPAGDVRLFLVDDIDHIDDIDELDLT